MKYTQRQWDRIVGYGKVPEQYRYVSNRKTNGQDSKKISNPRKEVKKDTHRCLQKNIRR